MHELALAVAAVAVAASTGAALAQRELPTRQRYVWTDLGAIVGPSNSSYAIGINNRGQVIGNSRTASDAQHAFIWQSGQLTDLGTLGGHSAFAVALNDRGQVVGMSSTSSGTEHAFVWRGGRRVQVGRTGTTAGAINSLGQVIGRSPALHGSALVPFVWQNGRLTRLPALDGVGPPFGGVYALNDHGGIVGDSYTDVGGRPFDHAVLWTRRR